MNPQIKISGEELDGRLNADSPDGESVDECDAADAETQAKVQSVFQQVRSQIRSRVAVKASQGAIVQLVDRLKDKQALEQSRRGEKGEQLTCERKAEDQLGEDALCALFERKIEGATKLLRLEFEEHLSKVRGEMRAYTEQALKDLEAKIQKTPHKERQEAKGQDKKQKPPAPALYKRGRALTRTMTTIIPKTSPSVIVGPRAKSETLTSSKTEHSRIMPRDPGVSSTGGKSRQGRKPLPPVWPPLHQSKKTVKGKPQPGK